MIHVIKGLWKLYSLRGLELDQDKEITSDCECCGNKGHTVLGFIHKGESTLAAYCVKWTEGHEKDNPPWLLLSMGAWGEGTTGKDRVTAGCVLLVNENGRNFHIVDASTLESRSEDIVGHHLTSEEVMSGKIKDHFFKLANKVVMNDPRIQTLFGK